MDANGNKDLFSLVITSFQELWYVILYAVAILSLGFHLLHGFFSAFRSVGVHHPKYNQLIKSIGVVFAISLTFGYLIIPFFIYFNF